MSSKRNINGLTEKQQVFCDLYRACEDPEIRGNAKRCYMIAYEAKESSAEANGSRLIREDKHVKEYLDTKTEMVMEAADITQERILQEIANIAFLDPAELFDDNGNVLPVHSMKPYVRRTLGSMEITTEYEGKGESKKEVGYTNKIKFLDKKSSLELLMKNKGMLTEKVEHSGNVGGVLLVPAEVDAVEWQKQHFPQTNQT